MAEDYLVEKMLGHLAKYSSSDFEEEIPLKAQKLNGQPSHKCIDCGAPVWKKGSRCVTCHQKD